VTPLPDPHDAPAHAAPSAAPAFDCQRCGACCAYFRVSFYWGEADDAPGGTVPVALTRPVNAHLRCMAGTEQRPARCVALAGEIGREVACTIYAQRSSSCQELQPGDEKCLRARAAHGLETRAAGANYPSPAPSPTASAPR
jgi:Fe-S-cluster containining protein